VTVQILIEYSDITKTIFKFSATLKDSLEHRLKREGYVEGIDVPAQKGFKKACKNELVFNSIQGKKAIKRITSL
jgi:ribosomal protein S8